jgi:phosphoadenosine phosphosulfate reductase
MGIRAEESLKRAGRPRVDPYGKRKQILYKPIFHWLEYHIWKFIDAHNLPYPSLYEEGFNRLGCVVCPFIMAKNRRNLDRHKARWPGIYKVFEKVVADWFLNFSTKKHFFTQKTPEEYLAAYYSSFENGTETGNQQEGLLWLLDEAWNGTHSQK